MESINEKKIHNQKSPKYKVEKKVSKVHLSALFVGNDILKTKFNKYLSHNTLYTQYREQYL